MRASVNWGASGATLYYTITNRETGETVVSRTSNGISEIGSSGIYEVNTPYAVWPNRIIWDDGVEYAVEDFGTETDSRFTADRASKIDNTNSLVSSIQTTVNSISSIVAGVKSVVDNILRWFVNKRVVSRTGQILYADDGTTVLYKHRISDNGISVTREIDND